MKKLVLIFFIVAAFKVNAQQDAHYSQYMFNGLVINPAFAGSYGTTSFALFNRMQWVGMGQDFAGTAPSTQSLSYHTPIAYNTGGIGFHIQNDRLGHERRQSFIASGAYRVYLDDAVISFGLQGGMHTYQLLQPNIKDKDDERFVNLKGSVLPDVGTGIFYKSDKLYVGLSIPHLMETKINVNNFAASALRASLARHYFFTSAYEIKLSSDWKVVPSILFKIADNAPASLDGNLHIYFKDMIWAGGTYRFGDAYSFQLGTKVSAISKSFSDDIRLGYAFDLTSSDYRAYNKGTHEIMLMYDFGIEKPNKQRSPRFRF